MVSRASWRDPFLTFGKKLSFFGGCESRAPSKLLSFLLELFSGAQNGKRAVLSGE
jgi:hypothetical protein